MAQIEYTIKVRRDTAENWTANNTILAEGEIGLETDTKKMKIGDGDTPWESLEYSFVVRGDVGSANGVCPLNESSEIPAEYINQVAVAATTAFTPAGNIVATDVQAAIEELDSEKEPSLSTSTTDKFYRGDKSFEQVTPTNVWYEPSLKVGDPTHIDTLQELNNHIWSSGVMHGCDYTDNGDGTIGLSSGYALLRATADDHSPMYAVAISAQTPIVLNDHSVNYVYIDWNGGSPTFNVSTSIEAFNCLDKCIAWVVYRRGNVLDRIDARGQNVDGNRKSRRLFLSFSRFIHGEGGTALSTVTGLDIFVTAGKFYFMLNEKPHDAYDTSIAGTNIQNVFTLWYRDGSGDYISVANQKTVSTTTYDSGTGTPTTLGNNKYGVTWFYIVHNDPSSLHAVMGQVEYADQASAEAATPPTLITGLLSSMASLIGYVVYAKSATSFANIKNAFAQTFSSTSAVSHNNLPGLQGGTTNEYYHMTSSEHTGTGTGDFVRKTSPTLTTPLLSGLVDAADDSAAATAGVPVNGVYRTASVLKVRVT